MPETSSKNWNRWSDEQRDRRHRHAEEKTRSRPKNKGIVSSTKDLCPKCFKKVHGALEKHLEEFHGFKFRTVPSNRRPRVGKPSIKAEAKILRGGKVIGKGRLTTTISLAKELGRYLPRYILDFAQREGVKIPATSTPLPPNIVNKLRIEFRTLLEESKRR